MTDLVQDRNEHDFAAPSVDPPMGRGVKQTGNRAIEFVRGSYDARIVAVWYDALELWALACRRCRGRGIVTKPQAIAVVGSDCGRRSQQRQCCTGCPQQAR